MIKFFTLTLGILLTCNISFSQRTLPQPVNFPHQQSVQTTKTSPVVAYAQKNFLSSINSISSGDWNQPGTWDCGCVPTFQDDVTISPSHEITVNQNINVTSIFIDSTATLAAAIDGNVEINLTGNWINNGTFNPADSKVSLIGFDDQSILGVTVFYDLLIWNNRNVDILSPVSITNKLSLEDATLNTNDQLTFAYTADKTGELGQVITGTIVGEIITESSVDLVTANWFSTASPVTNATINQWNDDVTTSGFTGSDYPNYNFVNISYFAETSGYVSVNNITDSIHVGAGYFIYEVAGVHPYDLQGTPVVGDFTFPVTYTDTLSLESKGWNLLGNPYMATINWENQAGWTKNNLGQAIYLWDANTQSYKVYMNGYQVNGGSPIVKPFDNFFIAALDNPELAINELAKQEGEYTPLVPQNNYFKFSISGTGTTDEIIIILDDNASENYDIANDAIRIFNNTKTEIATISADDKSLCISSLPMIQTGIDIPLIINSPSGGDLTLDILNLPEELNSCVALENQITNEIYNLQEISSLTFSIGPTVAQEVFVLHIGGSVSGIQTNVTCNGFSNGSITATGSGDGNWDYYWYDNNNNLIESDLGQNGSSTLDSLAAGTYTLVIGNLDFCPSLTQTLSIEEPDPLTIVSEIMQPNCNEANSGGINTTAAGGSPDYTYLWNTGDTSQNIDNLAGGTYHLAITDMNGCETSQSFDIEDATLFTAAFDVQQITPQEGGLNEVMFNNTSENGASYLWDFGDGETDTAENPTHIYTTPGEYVVTLTVTQGECSLSFNYVLFVDESNVSVSEIELLSDILLVESAGEYRLNFDFDSMQDVTISVHNLLGQEINTNRTKVQQGTYELELPKQTNQVFFVRVINQTNQSRKIFKIIQK